MWWWWWWWWLLNKTFVSVATPYVEEIWVQITYSCNICLNYKLQYNAIYNFNYRYIINSLYKCMTKFISLGNVSINKINMPVSWLLFSFIDYWQLNILALLCNQVLNATGGLIQMFLQILKDFDDKIFCFCGTSMKTIIV